VGGDSQTKTTLRTPALWRPLAIYLLFLVGGDLRLRIDPFSLSRLTKFYSPDLLAVAMADCYPGAPGGPTARPPPAPLPGCRTARAPHGCARASR